MEWKIEHTIIVILLAIFIFLSINFSFQISLIYISFLVLSYFILDKDYSVHIVIKRGGHLVSILWAMGMYILLIFLSIIVFSLFNLTSTLSSIFSAILSSTPVFADSVILNFFTFGIFIATTETLAIFGRFMEFTCDKLKVQAKKSYLMNPKLWIAIIGISIFFVILHFTAKGIHNIQALTIVGIMAFISLLSIVLTDGDLKPAIYFHILANSIAMALRLGILSMAII